MREYSTGAHTRHRLRYHLVWIPKNRSRLLVGEVAGFLRSELEAVAGARGWTIGELNVQPDHVHMLVQLGPDVSVARAVQLLKGVSSFRARRKFPRLAGVMGRRGLWGDGYFAETVGAVAEETIRRYIREQPERDQSLP